MSIIIKTSEEITAMRQTGKIVATILDVLRGQLKPGMETRDLDISAARELKDTVDFPPISVCP
jgi:methionine aminopeptidase